MEQDHVLAGAHHEILHPVLLHVERGQRARGGPRYGNPKTDRIEPQRKIEVA